MGNKLARLSNKIAFDGTTSNIIEMSKPNSFRKEYMSEWPVVYVITGDEEAYVGETVDAGTRMAQHYQNPERRKLKNVQFISDDSFNKSVILDLESFLISHMSADGVYKLQNGNMGQQKHDYFEKEQYEEKFEEIWEELRKNRVARKTVKQIENSNLFKYSPYKSLTSDQYFIVSQIIKTLTHDIENGNKSNFLVNGGAGTGKTVLGIYLLKLLITQVDEESGIEDEEMLENLQKIHTKLRVPKIGIVVSMANLRAILQDTFKNTYGLHEKMVLKPSQIARADVDFDILIVDEAHRLKTARNVGAEIGNIYENNNKLGLDEKEGTQLDWILKKSKHAILFYDKSQSIKRADVDACRFNELSKQNNCHNFELKTQIRCAEGGQEYIDYVRGIFSNNPPVKMEFSKYDFRIFDNVRKMTNEIICKNEEFGLCRNLAGYAWKWNTKKKLHFSSDFERNKELTEEYIKNGMYDIDIDGEKYIWNSQFYGWLSSENSINEIGCVHTIQGFDLNYAGVIIGDEVKYDWNSHKIYIEPNNYFDANGKSATSEADLLQYIMNIYQILCTRGIKGTYVYACDDGLRKYLKQYIKSENF